MSPHEIPVHKGSGVRRPQTVLIAAQSLLGSAVFNLTDAMVSAAQVFRPGIADHVLPLVLTGVFVIVNLTFVGVPIWIATAALTGSGRAAVWAGIFLLMQVLTLAQATPLVYVSCLLTVLAVVFLWLPGSRHFAKAAEDFRRTRR